MRLEQLTAQALERVKYDKYLLAEAVAQRSKQIGNGTVPCVDMDPKKYKHADIAIAEIADGCLEVKHSSS